MGGDDTVGSNANSPWAGGSDFAAFTVFVGFVGVPGAPGVADFTSGAARRVGSTRIFPVRFSMGKPT